MRRLGAAIDKLSVRIGPNIKINILTETIPGLEESRGSSLNNMQKYGIERYDCGTRLTVRGIVPK